MNIRNPITLILILLGLSFINCYVEFTGFADVDFAPNNPFLTSRDLALYHKFNDTKRATVGRWLKTHNRTSGVDTDAIHVLYDDSNDVLYVGIQCAGICGDTDGDGNPSGVDPLAPAGSLGDDNPNLCFTEQFSVMFWLNMPTPFSFVGKPPGYFFPTMVVGVDYPSCIWNTDNDDTDFYAYEWQDYQDCLWPIPLTDGDVCYNATSKKVLAPGQDVYSGIKLHEMHDVNSTLYPFYLPPPNLFSYFPNITHPHIEFTLEQFSKYPQQDFTPKSYTDKMSVGVSAASGSSADTNGEDTVFPESWVVGWDCFGWPNGDAVYDECSVCGGDNSSCWDCKHIPNGPNVYDACGVCEGDNTSCWDCFHMPNGVATYDKCGVCGGDNSTCECLHYLGYDLADVDYALLRWTVSASILKIDEVLDVLGDIKTNLNDYDYKSKSLELSQYIDVLHSFCDHCLDTFDYAQLWFAEYLSGACEGVDCQSRIEIPDDATYHL